MVSSRKVHCAYCQKKCSGNVLRYQDQYYHKQCFELEQSESLVGEPEPQQRPVSVATSGFSEQDQSSQVVAKQQQQQPTTTTSTRIFTTHHSQQHHQQQQHYQKKTTSNGHLNTSGETNSTGSSSASLASQQQQASNRSPMQASKQVRSPTPGAARTDRQQQQQYRSATLPNSISSPANGFSASGNGYNTGQQILKNRTLDNRISGTMTGKTTLCAGCKEKIIDGQALIALDAHWHVWCFKCTQCRTPLHGEYVAKDGKAYCEKDYQKLFGITCVYCKRYITGKVLQAGEAHHFHPSCARCSKCGDPFVPGEEMYLQGEVTWHPRCGPGPNGAESSLMETDDRSQLHASRAQSPTMSDRTRSRSASPFSYISRQYGRASPAYADSEAVGDLSRIYTISYLNSDPNQGYLRRPVEPYPPKSPQFSRPTSLSRLAAGAGGGVDRSRCSSRSQQQVYSSSTISGPGGGGGGRMSRERSVPRGMYGILSGMRSGSSSRARSPSMMNEEPIQMAAYPSGQKPPPNSLAKIERDDFPAPPFPYPDRHHHHQQHQQQHHHHKQEHHQNLSNGYQQADQQRQVSQERSSRPRSREITSVDAKQLQQHQKQQADQDDLDSTSSAELDPQFRKEEEELSKIANGIGKIFLQTLKEREKLRAWKRANLDPRNASRTPSATRELPSRLRYDNPTNASPSRDMDRPRHWEEDELGAGEHSPTRTRSSLGRPGGGGGGGGGGASSAISSSYGYKVVQSNRSTPKPGYGLTSGPYSSGNTAGVTTNGTTTPANLGDLSFAEQQRIAQARAADLLGRQGVVGGGVAAGPDTGGSVLQSEFGAVKLPNFTSSGSVRSLASAAHFRRSMPNVANLHHLHQEGPPKLYPYHLLATSNYRLPPDVDRCHLERHLSNEEFQYIFHCDRLDFYRLPEWKRNELKRRARLF